MTVLFTAGAKLLGVYFVYLTVVYLVNAALLAGGDRGAADVMAGVPS